ncbi:MAG: prepilin peptidase [Lactobacillus sp.]|nr:prepilin peptidase [Lactobacillus sp.]
MASFLGCAAQRLPQGRSLLGRSMCDTCGQTLAWFDLVPILGFLKNGGRARCCQAPIDPGLPLAELLSGLGLCALVQANLPLTWPDSIILATWFLILLGLSLLDHCYQFIYPVLLLPLVATYWLTPGVDLAEFGQDALLALGLLLGLGIFAKVTRGLGGGDVYLLSLVGFQFGLAIVLWTLIFSCGLCLLVCLTHYLRGRFDPQAPLAFIPYLTIGLVLTQIG